MEELINLLHTGEYSCTIANKGEIRTFTQRGVADIYDLLTQEPEFLKGASTADRKGSCRPDDSGRYQRIIYRYYQYQSSRVTSEIRYKSWFYRESTFYLES